MPYGDNNVERRNLSISSLAVIVYYAGGGHLIKNGDGETTLNLPLINIAFDNICALTIMFWSVLLWFALRYYQLNRERVKEGLDDEIPGYRHLPSLIKYAEKKIERPYRTVGECFLITQLRRDSLNNWILDYQLAENGVLDTDGNLQGPRVTKNGTFRIENSFSDLRVKATILFRAAVQLPGFGSNIVPYILFYIALLLGLNSLITFSFSILQSCLP